MPDSLDVMQQMAQSMSQGMGQGAAQAQQGAASMVPLQDDSQDGQQQAPKPPRMGGLPNIVQLIGGMINPNSPRFNPTATPGRPSSRADVFENFIGNFLGSMAQGLSQAGTGPGANLRGFAGAVTAPYQRDLQQFQMQRQAAQDQARLEQTQAQTAATQTQSKLVPYQPSGPAGPTVYVPQGKIADILKAQLGKEGKVESAATRAKSATDVANINAAAKVQAATGRPPSDPLYQITRQLNPNLQPGTPEFAAKWEEMRMKEKTDPGVQRMQILLQRSFHPVNDAQGNVVGWVNPVTRKFVSGSEIPELPNAGVVPPKPPSNVIGMAAAAGTMLQHTPEIRQLILQAAGKQIDSTGKLVPIKGQEDKLGPGAGRWNEFMTGKVGATDPTFMKLRDNISLLQTRLMQAHVGMAGSDKMMEHFKGLIDSGKQSPENMLAAMDVIESYLGTYRGMSSQAAGGGAVPNPPVPKKGAKSDPVSDLVNKYKPK